MTTVEALGRSLRGTAALLNRRGEEALLAFDLTLDGFWTSFRALALTAPAYVVALALERRRLGSEGALFDDPTLALIMLVAHGATLLALPLAMIPIARRASWSERYVPFVVVTNWLQVFGSLLLSGPGLLYVLGFESAALTALLTLAFALIVLRLQWMATRLTLRTGEGPAAAIVGLGILLDMTIVSFARGLAG